MKIIIWAPHHVFSVLLIFLCGTFQSFSPVYTIAIFFMVCIFRVAFYLIQISRCLVLRTSWFCFPISLGNFRAFLFLMENDYLPMYYWQPSSLFSLPMSVKRNGTCEYILNFKERAQPSHSTSSLHEKTCWLRLPVLRYLAPWQLKV